MKSDSKVLVAGANGMVGSAIVRNLREKGHQVIIKGTRNTVDFTDQEATDRFFQLAKPEYVFLTAARCGGILDNINCPVNYLLDNLNIQNNVISSSYKYGVKKLMFFASSCVYPKGSPMPIKEETLMMGNFEKTHEFYSIAKVSGIKLCEAYRKQYGCDFISVNPSNIYGIENKVDSPNAHVMSSLIYKIWKAKKENISEVECFGDGSPKREFLYSDDLADAAIFLMDQKIDSFINIGTGTENSIAEIVDEICNSVQYDGRIVWNTSKPNGAPRRVLDVSKLNSLGWKPKTSLKEGIEKIINHLNHNYV
jgi:GDP-L-fucose synthase